MLYTGGLKMVTKDEIKTKLVEHIIDKTKTKWNEKKPNIENKLVSVSSALDGDVLLEEDVDEHGRVKGWITIPLDGLVSLLERRDNPSIREEGLSEDEIRTMDVSLKDLTATEFEEHTGIKRYMDKWRSKGIDI